MKTSQTLDDINKKFRQQLNQPLKFGDMDQIRILRDWIKAVGEFEENEQAKSDPNAPLINWRVDYSYRKYRTTYVEAKTYEEAETIAEEEYGHEDDFEIELIEGERKRA